MLQRLLSVAAATVLLLAASLAQSPLTTTFAGGETGEAAYFELTCTEPAGITITTLDLHFDVPAGTPGSISVSLSCESSLHTSINWLLRDSAQFVAAGPGLPTTCTLTNGIELSHNDSVGVAIVAHNVLNVFTPPSPLLPTIFTTNELTLSNANASLQPFAGASLPNRMVNANVHYAIGGTGSVLPCATKFGQGCGMNLSPVTMPFLGTPSITFRVRSENIPAPAPTGFMFHIATIGLDIPNAPLDAFGLTGCTWYARGDVAYAVPLFFPQSTWVWYPLGFAGIANDPALAGMKFYIQSGVVGTSLNTAFGGVGGAVSNGLEFTLGFQ